MCLFHPYSGNVWICILITTTVRFSIDHRPRGSLVYSLSLFASSFFVSSFSVLLPSSVWASDRIIFPASLNTLSVGLSNPSCSPAAFKSSVKLLLVVINDGGLCVVNDVDDDEDDEDDDDDEDDVLL